MVFVANENDWIAVAPPSVDRPQPPPGDSVDDNDVRLHRGDGDAPPKTTTPCERGKDEVASADTAATPTSSCTATTPKPKDRLHKLVRLPLCREHAALVIVIIVMLFFFPVT